MAVLAISGSGRRLRRHRAERRRAARQVPGRRSSSSFPASQRWPSRRASRCAIKNIGTRAIPNVAVTVLNPRYGTAAQAFGTLIKANRAGQPILASRSRPVWIIDQAPGPCGYSCRSRGPGGAATAYTNTWALGRLAPGHTAVFRWS